MARGLGFIGIGAQKAATTTVHHWLTDHPQLILPASKEAPFFDRIPVPTRQEYASYLTRQFGSSSAIAGKFTPQYMCFDWAADAIADLEPNARIIAILRDPVKRALSHWKMQVRLGSETRPFSIAIADLLRERGDSTKEEDGYIAFGEYGRILARYSALFPPDQLLILEDRRATSEPQEFLNDITDFLGVARHTPHLGFDVRFNVTPQRQRLFEKALWRVVPYRRLQAAAPERMRHRLGAALDRLHISRPMGSLSDELPPAVQDALQEHFMKDALLLRDTLGLEPYWLSDWAVEEAR